MGRDTTTIYARYHELGVRDTTTIWERDTTNGSLLIHNKERMQVYLGGDNSHIRGITPFFTVIKASLEINI